MQHERNYSQVGKYQDLPFPMDTPRVRTKLIELQRYGINIKINKMSHPREIEAHLSWARSALIPKEKTERCEWSKVWVKGPTLPKTPLDVFRHWLNKVFPLLNAPLFKAQYQSYSRYQPVLLKHIDKTEIIYVNAPYGQHQYQEVEPTDYPFAEYRL